MNERVGSGRSQAASDDSLERLFKHAGPRERPPEEDERLVRDALYSEWDRVTTRRLSSRRMTWMALAASVVVVIGSVAVLSRPGFHGGETGPIAQVQRVDNDIQVTDSNRGSSQIPISMGSELFAGYLIASGDGQISFDFPGGGSVRLATQTAIELMADSEVELIRGALYFDSQNMEQTTDRFLVRTSVGTVRHTGTQFAARQVPSAVEVSVREGGVALDRGGEQIVVAAGERVQVPEDGSRIRRQSIAIFGEEWHWADRMTPAFEIDGSNLLDYLNWVARETGHRLEFATVEAEQAARVTILRGSIDMEPLPMLSAVMATTDLEYRLLEGTLYIRLP